MPSLQIPAKKLHENNARDVASFLRAFAERLRVRGFRLKKDGPAWREVWIADPPLTLERSDDILTVTQEVEGRLPSNSPLINPLLNLISRCDTTAVGDLYATLLAESDDRAEILSELEVAMPENVGDVTEDFGTASDNIGSAIISGTVIAERELCRRVLVLMGCREEKL